MIARTTNTYLLYLCWLLSCVGMLSSLFFSQVLHLEPCTFCWYQRICLFPLVLFLGKALYQGDIHICSYASLLAFIGCLIAVYQVLIQEVPVLAQVDLCGHGPSCAEKVYIGVGSITLPMASALYFLFTSITLRWIYKKNSL